MTDIYKVQYRDDFFSNEKILKIIGKTNNEVKIFQNEKEEVVMQFALYDETIVKILLTEEEEIYCEQYNKEETVLIDVLTEKELMSELGVGSCYKMKPKNVI